MGVDSHAKGKEREQRKKHKHAENRKLENFLARILHNVRPFQSKLLYLFVVNKISDFKIVYQMEQ